jgi:mono/diheme cytochrome c family protein
VRRLWILPALFALLIGACTKRPAQLEEKPKAFGVALVSVGGDKQAASVGSQLDEPLVVQVNDTQGAPVEGALVRFRGPGGVTFQPDHGLTGSDGQFTTTVTLGGMPGHYQIAATTTNQAGKPVGIEVDEIALGYQETLGEKIYEVHCIRCHDSESTPERVSNHDNLDAPPHAFTNGAILNPMTDANLLAIISHGGAALNKSPEMPPYGNTLNKADLDALVAYIRAVADPPYRPQGVFYAGN